MPSVERDASRDSDRHLRHQHSSSSDGGRAIVPMWDSSDPDRAPPPLPMNPSSPSVAASRPNTSIAIQSAHAALTEKARESGYITNPPPKRIEHSRIEHSPERSLIKGATHKRMQSLHTGNVRDLSSFLEGGGSFSTPKSPEKSAGRPGTPHASKEYFSFEGRSPEKDSRFLLEGSSPDRERERESDSNRCTTPTPTLTPRAEITLRETPKLRPSMRKPPQSILGENAPPQSATMLALQNMTSKEPDTALSNVTNGSTALVRTPQTFDAISNQILSLTSIATSLQREMAQLSRRSKDNATDLISLKEATNARDEDIRKSLRELVTNLNENGSRASSNIYDSRNLYLENKAHNNSPSSRNVKTYVLPRIPSPNSFAASLDRESMTSPSSFSPDTVTSIALLEKVLREMGTKEGQDLLVSRLTEVSERLARDGSSTAKKLDDLLKLIKESTPQAVVLQNGGGAGSTKPRDFSFGEGPRLELDYESPRSGPMAQRVGALLAAGNKENAGPQGAARVSDVFNEDIVKLIRTIKDSVAQGGGLTAEVKALVRELRGEVLGMGREMGRKLDEGNSESAKGAAADKEYVERVVKEGLEELRGHMNQILREHQRQSAASIASRPAVDYQEIYSAMRNAVSDQNKSRTPALGKEDIIKAVKDAWENYKPEIEVQQFGLERDELLTCLKDGIQEFAPKHDGATRDEVFTAVVEGLKHFSPPRVEPPPSLSRDEILDAVRECLEEFEFPAAPAPEPLESGVTREDMLDAVKEGLHTFDFPINPPTKDVDAGLTRDDMLHAVQEGLKNFDVAANTTALTRDVGGTLTRDDVYEAVKAGFDDAPQMDAFSEQIMDRLHEIMETIQTEFKAVSDEAKQNVAAHGRDTEQVLDATKDGFERLRADIEAYVDRATGAEMKDDMLNHIRENFDSLRTEIDILISREPNTSSIDTVRAELESFRESMTTSLVPGGTGADMKDDILSNIRAELENFRESMTTSLIPGGASAGMKDDILNNIRDTCEILRTELDVLLSRESGITLDTIRTELESLRESMTTSLVPASMDSSEMKDEILNNIRENFDTLRTELEVLTSRESTISLDTVRAELDSLRESMTTSLVPGSSGSSDMKDEILNNIRENFDTLRTELEVLTSRESAISLDTVRAELDSMRESMATSLVPGSSGGNEMKDDIKDEILNNLRENFDSLRTDLDILISRESNTSLDTVRAELESLRESMTTSLVPGGSGGSEIKEEILSNMRENFDSLRTDLDLLMSKESSTSLDTVRAELENLRESMTTSLVPGSKGTEKDEILDTLKEGLENIRTEIERPRNDSNESVVSGTGEILDALHDGLDNLRTEVEKIVNKPVDMTVNYEILDTLKLGLEGVRADIDRLRESGHGERAVTEINDKAIVPVDNLNRHDIENLEVLITQLRIKVEALETMPPPVPQPIPGVLSRNDLSDVEEMLRNVQESVTGFTAQDRSADDDIVKKEDVEAIETLLRNTNAKLDGIDPEQAVKKEQVDAIEFLVGETRDGVNGLATKLEDISKKEDVSNLGSLVRDILVILEDLKDRATKESEDPEKVSKTDVDAVEAACMDIKTSIDQMLSSDIAALASREDVKNSEETISSNIAALASKEDVKTLEETVSSDIAALASREDVKNLEETILSDVAALASREDVKNLEETILSDIATLASRDNVKNLEEMVKEFKNRIETHAETNAKSFEERQAETVGVGERVTEVKTSIQEFRDAIENKLGNGVTSIESLGRFLEKIGDTIRRNANITQEVKEVSETMKAEFEKSNAGVVGSKLEADEKFQQTWDRFDTKLEEKFNDLVLKYDDAQATFDAATKAAEERDAKVEAALLETRTATDDMKLLNDNLGNTFNESAEKLGQASKTIFNRVDETFTKVEENHADAKAEHQLTRDEVLKTLGAIESVQDNVTEHNPNILESVKEVLLIVRQHFKHSKNLTTTIQETIAENPELPENLLLPPPVETYEDTNVYEKLDKLVDHVQVAKYDDSTVREKLDKLVEAFHTEKYDDAIVQEKLDRLVETVQVEKYDDNNVQEKLDNLVEVVRVEKYDDTNIQEKLDNLVEVVRVEKYDDTNIQEKLNELVEAFHTEKYDDSNVQEKMDKLAEAFHAEKYDDSNIQEKMDKLTEAFHAEKYDDSNIQEKMDKLAEAFHVEKYDDSGVQEKMDKLVEAFHAEKYDDSDVQEKMNKLAEAFHAEKYDDSHIQEKLEKLVEAFHTEKYDDSNVQDKLEKLVEAFHAEKYDDSNVQEKLDKLAETVHTEKYDDSHVQEKLDKLAETVQLEKYDDSHVQEKLDKLAETVQLEKYDDLLVQEKLDKLAETVKLEKYDDLLVQEKLDKLAETVKLEKYDDLLVQEKLDKLAESVKLEKYDDLLVQEKLDKLAETVQLEKYDDLLVHEKLDKLVDTVQLEKYDDIHVQEKLELLVEAVHVDKYDDTNVQEKLDQLVGHMQEAGKSFAQLDMLDKIHQKVMQTAAEVSVFVANQTQRIADDHEDKEKAVEEATIALEKRLAQKELVETSVSGLREEEDRLKASVAILKAEQEHLASQKMRLSADVSSLEMALKLRREELHVMEARAEGLERRILEGVIDHSRALLLTKPNKGRDAMSRKRVPSQATSITGSVMSSATSKTSNTTQSAVGMAMKGNRTRLSVPATNSPNGARRILSLNQITHNIPAGGFKRSHSVKSNGGATSRRKSSWGASFNKRYGDLDKENLTLKESEEDEEDKSNDDELSDEETMRRSSRATVLTNATGTGVSESIDGDGTEYTESISGDESLEEEEEEVEAELEPESQSLVLYGDVGQAG